MRSFGRIGLAASLILCTPGVSFSGIAGLHRVASGVSSPMFVTHAPGDTSRLFIAERGGAIRILDLNTGNLLATPFLTQSGIDTGGSEGGFLGLAFHPDYSNVGAPGFGKFYVKITTSGSVLTARIREYTVSDDNPNLADPGSMREILRYTNPAANHVGGWIGFSPNDGYLYIANGDGGGGNDTGPGHTPPSDDPPFTGGNAQDTTNNWLGKMLRIDVNSDAFPTDSSRNYAIPPTNPFREGVGSPDDDAGDDEIWAYGLRNPFRASFDRITSDLWIGDVGQGAREEVDFQPADSAGGENYGWRLREGSIQTPTSGIGGPKPPGNVDPVYDYERPINNPTNDPEISEQNQYRGTTVIGGYVYRGPDPSLQGQYIFLDRNAGQAGINYWMFDPDDPYGTVQNIDSMMTPDTGSASGPVSMGEDALGNLYIAYFSGAVYRIATDELMTGDFSGDGQVDEDDVDIWFNAFGTTGSNLAADANDDNAVDAADYVMLRKFFGRSVHDGIGDGSAVPEPSLASAALITAVFASGALGRRLHRAK